MSSEREKNLREPTVLLKLEFCKGNFAELVCGGRIRKTVVNLNYVNTVLSASIFVSGTEKL